MVIWTARTIVRMVGGFILFLGFVLLFPATSAAKEPGVETVMFLQRLPVVQQVGLGALVVGLLIFAASYFIPKHPLSDD